MPFLSFLLQKALSRNYIRKCASSGGRIMKKTRGWVMLAWERMCQPKGIGGIGFSDMHLFNIALLGRQVWRLMHCKETLCFKVLSAKYFPEGDMLRPKYCEKPSFTWSSIAKAINALKDGFLWQIGDGKSIDIRRDH
ncbi:hypothetical protein ES288_A10G137300v1 [Gossypium darwinii]|uniref:Reverse transcriptase zinc-binding domain-containing protein n=1 Tax=Gossypium darwinii TaxID=34276 RepID=A0A5D2EY44_GOSDA|nr:hypothetical protein ES288_A10G137300v1 [Gossypium darwinii]